MSPTASPATADRGLVAPTASHWPGSVAQGMLGRGMNAIETSAHYRRIAHSLQRLRTAATLPSLEQLAQEAGLSPFHFQRVFLAHAGLSPKEFWQTCALQRAKRSLLGEHSVLEAALEAGLSGPSRLHDLLVSLTALSPGEFRGDGSGLQIGWTVFDSIAGRLWLAATARGVLRLEFVDDEGSALLAELQVQWPRARLLRDDAGLAASAGEIAARLGGAGPQRPLGLALAGSGFRVQVWQALLRIPDGEVCSYSQLAALAGRPRAVRAVASAVAANPIAVLIPCHRVIRADGTVGDYHWGRERKQLLLDLELGRRRATRPA